MYFLYPMINNMCVSVTDALIKWLIHVSYYTICPVCDIIEIAIFIKCEPASVVCICITVYLVLKKVF